LRVIRQIAASRVVSSSRCARIAEVRFLGITQPMVMDRKRITRA
jgi:hypothetical protein